MIVEKAFLSERGFSAYCNYIAIKRHFTSSYDYFKYNGKVNVSQNSFISRRDAYQFQRLSKIQDYKNLILSNVVLNPKIWVGDLVEDSSKEVYLSWKKRTDSITQHFKDELSKLDDNFKLNFVSIDGQYPHIINLYLRKELSLEMVVILTQLTNSSGYWKKSVLDKVVFPDIINVIDKYEPFLVYSPEKMKKVIKNHFF